MYKQISNLTIGLDPILKCCLKLQIKDILNLKLNSQLYLAESACMSRETKDKDSDNNHQVLTSNKDNTGGMYVMPNKRVVNRVEVMGIVVRVEKRERRQSYAVDDGTGVITCTCWQNKRTESPITPDLDLSQSLREKLVSLCSERESASHGYDIGDLILVRGRITEFREQKEIDVLDHYKVDNPNYECERILSMPALYAEYKKIFSLPKIVQQQLQPAEGDCTKILENLILNHINKSSCFHTFTVSDVLSWPDMRSTLFFQQSSDINEESTHAMIVTSALCVIGKGTGKVFQLSDGTQRFQIVRPDSPVGLETMAILQKTCSSGNFEEIGCHIQHLHEKLIRTSPFNHVGMAVMRHLIDLLEENSDVIALGEHRYLPVS